MSNIRDDGKSPRGNKEEKKNNTGTGIADAVEVVDSQPGTSQAQGGHVEAPNDGKAGSSTAQEVPKNTPGKTKNGGAKGGKEKGKIKNVYKLIDR